MCTSSLRWWGQILICHLFGRSFQCQGFVPICGKLMKEVKRRSIWGLFFVTPPCRWLFSCNHVSPCFIPYTSYNSVQRQTNEYLWLRNIHKLLFLSLNLPVLGHIDGREMGTDSAVHVGQKVISNSLSFCPQEELDKQTMFRAHAGALS